MAEPMHKTSTPKKARLDFLREVDPNFTASEIPNMDGVRSEESPNRAKSANQRMVLEHSTYIR